VVWTYLSTLSAFFPLSELSTHNFLQKYLHAVHSEEDSGKWRTFSLILFSLMTIEISKICQEGGKEQEAGCFSIKTLLLALTTKPMHSWQPWWHCPSDDFAHVLTAQMRLKEDFLPISEGSGKLYCCLQKHCQYPWGAPTCTALTTQDQSLSHAVQAA
jgi:hypothetical protein